MSSAAFQPTDPERERKAPLVQQITLDLLEAHAAEEALRLSAADTDADRARAEALARELGQELDRIAALRRGAS